MFGSALFAELSKPLNELTTLLTIDLVDADLFGLLNGLRKALLAAKMFCSYALPMLFTEFVNVNRLDAAEEDV